MPVINDASFKAGTAVMGDENGKGELFDGRAKVRDQATQMPPAAKADFSHTPSHVSASLDTTSIYEVQAGDDLSSIAKHFYGDANAWQTLFDANRDQLTDPDRILAGQMLKIPARS